MGDADPPLLSVRGLSVAFPGPAGDVLAVEEVSFDVGRGEVVALVGESGSGKTLTGLALARLVPEPGRIAAGTVRFEGVDVGSLGERDLSRLRGGAIGYVFQEPSTALDPVRTIGSELVAVLRRHRGLGRREARAEALSWLRRVALPGAEERLRDLPHRMSGGMRQRAMLALALAGGPRLLVADEPTTALDVTIQAQVLGLLASLREELDLAVLLVTHDLGVVREVAGRALVMYAGHLVEEGPAEDVLAAPAHPYTRGLLASLPSGEDAAPGRRLPALEGSVPEPDARPPGCSFAPRCPDAFARCRTEAPGWYAVPGASGTRRAACFLREGDAP